MSEINCYIPIKLRITGRPSDSQLDQLGDALVRALTARMAFAERVIEDRHGATFGGDCQPVREAYDPKREEGATDSYLVPSYNGGGDLRPVNFSRALSGSPWIVLKAIDFHATVEKFIEFVASINPELGGLKDLYHDQLMENRWVEVWLVKVNHKQLLKADLAPQIDRRATELRKLDGNQTTLSACFIKPDMRHLLSKMAKEESKSAQLLDLDLAVNEKDGLVRYAVQNNGLNESLDDLPPDPELWLLPGARVLFACMVLPMIELADRVILGREEKIRVSWSRLEIVQDGFSDMFKKEFHVEWKDFKREFGKEQTILKLVPFRVSRRTSFETLKHLISSHVLKSHDPNSIPFGDLYLLNQGGLDHLRKLAIEGADWLSNDVTRQIKDESRLGHWEKGWAGAYLHIDIDITDDQLAAVRHLPNARIRAEWLRNNLLQGDSTDGKWSDAMSAFLSNNYGSDLHSEKRPPGGGPFEYLLETLERNGDFDKLFDKVRSSDHESLQQFMARLSLATRYATHERVRRLLESLASRTLRKNRNSYWEQEQEIWLDRNLNAVIKAGQVLGDVFPNLYIFKRKAKRLKPSRISDCRKALIHEQLDLIGKVAGGKDTNEYTQEDFVLTTTCAAVQSVGLTDDDIEEIIIQRSLKLMRVEMTLEKALPQYNLTFHVVERIAGERDWHIVSTQTIDQSAAEFEDDQTRLWTGEFGKVYEKVMTGVLAVGVIGLALEGGLIAVLLKIAGGGAAVGASIAISEATLVVRWILGDAEITLETIMEAALEGYLNAIGFNAAGFGIKLVATKLGTAALKKIFIQRVATGIIGGGGSAALVEFSKNLIDIAINRDGKGDWSSLTAYVEKMGSGAFLGLICESVFFWAPQFLKAVAKNEINNLGQAAKLLWRDGIRTAQWKELTNKALDSLSARLNLFFADAITQNAIRAIRERASQLAEQLAAEYRQAVFRNVLESAPKGLSPSAVKGLEKFLDTMPAEQSNSALSFFDKLKREPNRLNNFLENLNGMGQSSINHIIDGRLAVYLRALELSSDGMSPSAVQGLEKFLGASRADLSNEAALSLLDKLGPTQLPNLLKVLSEMEGESITNILKSLRDSSASQAREMTQFLAESKASRESFVSFSSKRIFENRKALIQAIEDAHSSDSPKNPTYDKYKEATEENILPAEKAGKEYSKALRKINTDNRPKGSQFGKQDQGSYEDTFLYYNRAGVNETALAATEENIYLNVNANYAPEVMRFVVHEIVDKPGQFPGILKAKVAGANLVSKRVDNLVIYAVDKEAMKKALERILEYHAAHPHHFQTTTPPMTLRIANGVGIGSRLQGSKLSFGQLRAQSMGDVLMQTKDIENLLLEEFLERVLSDLERKGVNRYAPHTNLPRSERISRGDAEAGGNSETQAAQSSLPGPSGAEIPRVILNLGPGEAPPHTQSGKTTQSHMTRSSGAEKPPVILYRGTTYQFIHGGSKNLHDLGNGLYLTYEPGLALQYAQEHRVSVNVDTPGDPGIVIRVETTHEELGRVLDVYNNKALKDEWESFLEIFESGRNLKKGLANENYSRFFETWLKNRGMDVSQFDTIIGPEYVRGGSQICVRNKAIAEKLIAKAEEWARAREPLSPAYPDAALPIDKKLLDKLKE